MRFFDMTRRDEQETPADILGVRPQAREHAIQRLQIGITGVVLMILLVGLASIIQNRAKESERGTVPEAAPTTEPSASATQSDPLVEAGVVPDLPSGGEAPDRANGESSN